VATRGELKKLQNTSGETAHAAVTLNYEIELLRLQRKDREDENRKRNRALRSFVFEQVPGAAGEPATVLRRRENCRPVRNRTAATGASPGRPDGNLKLTGGGEVVGRFPKACRPSACRSFRGT
jgi:SulP family sulfate permease